MEKAVVPTIDVSGIDGLEEEYLAKFETNKEVHDKIRELKLSRGMVKANLGKLIAYYDDNLICQHCPGYEKCPKEETYFMMSLSRDGDYVSRSYAPCHCFMERASLLSHYLYHDFPDEWLGKGLSDLPKDQRTSSFLSSLMSIFNNPDKPFLFVNGEPGVGKSFLSVCWLNALISSAGFKVAFLGANKRFDELKGTSINDKARFDSLMNELMSLDVLVIDDFGSEFVSDYLRDQIVIPLISERAKAKRLTIFCSDFTVNEIQTLYSNSKIGAIRAKQLISVIASNGREPVVLKKSFDSNLGM